MRAGAQAPGGTAYIFFKCPLNATLWQSRGSLGLVRFPKDATREEPPGASAVWVLAHWCASTGRGRRPRRWAPQGFAVSLLSAGCLCCVQLSSCLLLCRPLHALARWRASARGLLCSTSLLGSGVQRVCSLRGVCKHSIPLGNPCCGLATLKF